MFIHSVTLVWFLIINKNNMDIPSNAQVEIKVNVDITKDQLQNDSAEKFQVELSYEVPIESYTSQDGTVIKGKDLTKTVKVYTTSKELQKLSQSLQIDIDNHASLLARKAKVDSLVPEVLSATELAVTNLQIK